MTTDVNNLFEAYLAKHADSDLIDFEPLLNQYPNLKASLEEKIKAYQKVIGLLHSDEPKVSDSSSIGKVIGGCQILKVLGQGGMGIVYLARQEKLQRPVVLKVLRPHISDNPTLKERFQRESRIIARLNHPNIIPVYDVGEEDGTLFIIMKLIEGAPLSDVLQKLTPLDRATLNIDHVRSAIAASMSWETKQSVELAAKSPTEFFCRLIIKIADAAQHAHDSGIIHRDIKPSNILIDANGEPYLLDFGLSHDSLEKSLTLSGEFLGTPIYSAPECFENVDVSSDVQIDVYSLGVTLYECLTGKLPFDGNSLFEVFSNIKNKDPIRPKKHWKQIPSDLEMILGTAIKRYKKMRYRSAKSFGSDLDKFLNYLPIEAVKVSFAKRAYYQIRGIGLQNSILFMSVVIVFIFGLFFYSNNKDRNDENITKLLGRADEMLIANDLDGANKLIGEAIKLGGGKEGADYFFNVAHYYNDIGETYLAADMLANILKYEPAIKVDELGISKIRLELAYAQLANGNKETANDALQAVENDLANTWQYQFIKQLIDHEVPSHKRLENLLNEAIRLDENRPIILRLLNHLGLLEEYIYVFDEQRKKGGEKFVDNKDNVSFTAPYLWTRGKDPMYQSKVIFTSHSVDPIGNEPHLQAGFWNPPTISYFLVSETQNEVQLYEKEQAEVVLKQNGRIIDRTIISKEYDGGNLIVISHFSILINNIFVLRVVDKAIFSNGKAYVLTVSSPERIYDLYQKDFEVSLGSFKLAL